MITKEAFSIRQFSPPETGAYKAIRLEALQLEPGMFGNSYAMEAALTEQEWLERITAPGNARFGLYHLTELIGLTGIVADKEKPGEAYMTQSYIRKAYRGRGLSRLLYQARIEWAKANAVKRLIIGHKESNIISKAANQHFGFVYTHSENREWPDGSNQPMLYYELFI